MLKGDAIDRRFDRGVRELDDQNQHQAADQQRAFDAGIAEPKRKRREHRKQNELEAERAFLEGGGEAGQRMAGGREDPAQAP